MVARCRSEHCPVKGFRGIEYAFQFYGSLSQLWIFDVGPTSNSWLGYFFEMSQAIKVTLAENIVGSLAAR